MSIHVFANVVTPFGVAANNRAETEGNVTTLQKLIWQGQVHSSVSAEAIRFSLRRLLAESKEECNRSWAEDNRQNNWKEPGFSGWAKENGKTYIDDDLLGFMAAEAGKEEGESGKATVRRAVLEITRAISLTPWTGDVTFNAASPGATPSAQKKGTNPVPYGAEMHATRYQYAFALTPERLREKSRALTAIRSLGNLHTVAGNHARFLFDFSPDAIVLRVSEDPAPRMLYCFDTEDNGRTVSLAGLLRKIKTGDIDAKEIFVGGSVAEENTESCNALCEAGVKGLFSGVKEAIDAVCKRLCELPVMKG